MNEKISHQGAFKLKPENVLAWVLLVRNETKTKKGETKKWKKMGR